MKIAEITKGHSDELHKWIEMCEYNSEWKSPVLL